MYLHMRTARKMFRCTAQTWNRVTILCYFQIYIVDRYTFCTDAYLVMDFQILLSPVVDFDGHIVLALSVRPSSFRPSDLPAMDLGKLTKGALWSHLPPTADQVGNLSVAYTDLCTVMAPSANNGVKLHTDHTDKNKRVAETDSTNLWILYFYLSCYFGGGYIFSKCPCFISNNLVHVKPVTQFNSISILLTWYSSMLITNIILRHFNKCNNMKIIKATT